MGDLDQAEIDKILKENNISPLKTQSKYDDNDRFNFKSNFNFDYEDEDEY
jgi:hypothetical protein